MADSPIELAFTRGWVYTRDRVYIVAHAPELERQRMYLTLVLRWVGEWASFRIDWPVAALCATQPPELTVYFVGPQGQVQVAVPSGFSQEVVDDSDEGPAHRGDLRDMRLIGEHVYVTGMGRQVYRRTDRAGWHRCDQGVLIPKREARVAGFNSIDGFAEDQIYAAGWGGEIWHYDQRSWRQLPSLTNLKLQRVLCVPPRTVYACGQVGLLLRGFQDRWEVIEQEMTQEQFWGMEWFAGELWLATTDSVFMLKEPDKLVEVDFGLEGEAVTCGCLHANDGVMWSIGRKHLFSTADGANWTRHVFP